MDGPEVKKICDLILEGWKGQLGIHTHDNKGLSLSNSLVAVNNGVTWCDGTMQGMGRGAGNVSTESLLMEFCHLGVHSEGRCLLEASEKFKDLKRKYSWGPNPYYHFAANHSIHPTYVQSLLSEKRYQNSDLFSILEAISRSPASSFSEKICEKLLMDLEKVIMERGRGMHQVGLKIKISYLLEVVLQ